MLGKVVWLGALVALSGTERTPQRSGCMRWSEEFLRRERRSSVGGETEYAFRHVLVRDVAYGQIPRAQRADKHQRAADGSRRSRPIATTRPRWSRTTTRRRSSTPVTPASRRTSSSGARGTPSATPPTGPPRSNAMAAAHQHYLGGAGAVARDDPSGRP